MGSGRRRYTDEQLVRAVGESRTMSDVLRTLGLVPRGGNYETVREHMNRLGLVGPRRMVNLSRRLLRSGSMTAAELADAIRVSRSKAKAAALLGVSVRRLNTEVERHGVDISHFRGQGWRLGSRKPVVPARPLAELLVQGRLYPTHKLKKRLIAEGLKEPQCEGCLLYDWCGEPISLELDHVNGDRHDNRLENLRLLCPNCHAMTATYRGRNIGRQLTYTGSHARVAEWQTRGA